MGEIERALELHQSALDLRRRTLGENNRWTASSLGSVADDLRRLGRPTEALERSRAGLAVLVAALGPDTWRPASRSRSRAARWWTSGARRRRSRSSSAPCPCCGRARTSPVSLGSTSRALLPRPARHPAPATSRTPLARRWSRPGTSNSSRRSMRGSPAATGRARRYAQPPPSAPSVIGNLIGSIAITKDPEHSPYMGRARSLLRSRP
jgi:hypothetical protein